MKKKRFNISSPGFLFVSALFIMIFWDDLAISGVFGGSQSEIAQYISISWFEQLVVIISSCVFKPTYMAISFLLILILWKQNEVTLVRIKWSLITFLAGEVFCAINYLFVNGESDFFEILHGLGMVGLWIFLPWAFFNLLDEQVIGFKNPEKRCAIQGLCHKCWKNQDTTCGVRRFFPYIAFSLAILSLMPITAPLKPFKITMTVNGYETIFRYSELSLLFELRGYAVIAALLMLFSAIISMKGNHDLDKIETFFFTGFGFMFYSLFRFFLLGCYDNLPQWMNFWEETTELMMISLLAYFLFVFRRQTKIGINLKFLKSI